MAPRGKPKGANIHKHIQVDQTQVQGFHTSKQCSNITSFDSIHIWVIVLPDFYAQGLPLCLTITSTESELRSNIAQFWKRDVVQIQAKFA